MIPFQVHPSWYDAYWFTPDRRPAARPTPGLAALVRRLAAPLHRAASGIGGIAMIPAQRGMLGMVPGFPHHW